MPKNEFLSRLAVLLAVTTCVAIAAPSAHTGSATGTDWDTFGTPGNGVNQFAGPTGIFVNPAGQIYVVDARNSRLVRVNDMNGTSWTTFGTTGREVNQFIQPQNVFVSTTGAIYVADAGNHRLVRLDDMNGKGWADFDTHTVRGIDHWYWSPTGISVNSMGQI